MRIERRSSPHRIAGREGHVPSWIVLHTTVGSFDSAAWWFEDPDSGVSAHYLVGLDGRVASFADEEDAARHAGRLVRPSAARAIEAAHAEIDVNLITIGIELVDDGDPHDVERTDAQYAAAARLVARAASRWSIPIDAGCGVSVTASSPPTRRVPATSTSTGSGGGAGVACGRSGRAPDDRGAAAGAECRGVPAGVARARGALVRRRDRIGRRLHGRHARPPRRIAPRADGPDQPAAADRGRVGRRTQPPASPRRRREPGPGLDRAGRRRRDAGSRRRRRAPAVPLDRRRGGAGVRAPPATGSGVRMWTPHRGGCTACSSWEPDQAMPDAPLHLPPVPVDLSHAAWLRTTIRLRHLSAADDTQVEAAPRRRSRGRSGRRLPVGLRRPGRRAARRRSLDRAPRGPPGARAS